MRRRDLDGIRGIGMIGVLGLHGGRIPGGDFGLVAFFVLSGYLITTLLLRERDKTGRIDGRQPLDVGRLPGEHFGQHIRVERGHSGNSRAFCSSRSRYIPATTSRRRTAPLAAPRAAGRERSDDHAPRHG